MNLFSKIMLAIYSFFLAVISAVLIFICFEGKILDNIYNYLVNNVLSVGYAKLIMLLISLLLFILSILFLISVFKTGKDKKGVNKQTEIGEITISLVSIENIALSTSKRLNGVSSTKANVTKQDEGVLITIRMVVFPEVNIPALSERMQNEVKSSVEDISGVKVNSVRVVVENITENEGYKPRIE